MSAEAASLQRVELEVARILAATEHPVDAYEAILAAIGGSFRWALGAVWETVEDGIGLRCVKTWHAGEHETAFEALSTSITLVAGEGLPGRVLASGRPAWLVDAPSDGNFPRAAVAREDGLQAAVSFPLRSASGVVGVVEFFAREQREPDEALIATMDVLGSQIGGLVARRRAEERIAANESRLRAMLEASLDAVITMTADGRVIGWNRAAETVFGYPADEAIGQELAELIVPPSLRAAHRAGLARFLETGQGVVLDRRIEITGLRRDGSELPVELTITRIALDGPPTFTGYLRDITERKLAEANLRASRARLVEVADAERRRLQRNLHDGAQQRLTAVLLALGRLRESTGEGASLLDAAIDELALGLQEIRELASGLHPSVLTERGLGAALEALALRAAVPVELDELPARDLPPQVEAAAYYVVAEALANVQKHAQARRAVVRARVEDDRLRIEVSDDGFGGADATGQGLRGLADRVEALDGGLTVRSPSGGGTTLLVEIPVI
jgi:PAS domain S-box-containing protein